MQRYADLVVGNVPSAGVSYGGGRSVLVTRATAYGTSQLQLQLGDGTWVNVGAASAADGVSVGIDLPAGVYRLNASGQTGMTAQLQSVSYS